MKQFKESNNRMNLAKKGMLVLKAVIHWQSNTWRINYYTLKGGWARLDSYCAVSYPTREKAEAHLRMLVKQHPTKFIEDK